MTVLPPPIEFDVDPLFSCCSRRHYTISKTRSSLVSILYILSRRLPPPPPSNFSYLRPEGTGEVVTEEEDNNADDLDLDLPSTGDVINGRS